MSYSNGSSSKPVALILASASPRRRSLLADLGLQFEVKHPSFDEEEVVAENPAELVEKLAKAKAETVALEYPRSLVVGADTVVVLEGEVLGKPEDEDHAVDMLSRLSGRTHQVYTGVAIVHRQSGRERVEHECTQVTFGRFDRQTLLRYVQSGEPMDKAGAYGIQGLGATLVERVEGCYFNVVGLPLFRFSRMLGEMGLRII